MLKSFRYLLLPFSLIYGGIVWLRNWLFDKNILRSSSFNFPIICIGNLAVGGTGKTPMVEYLIRLLKKEYATATLSRGYKRKTKGFAIADENTTALEIGDEPMQFHQKFPDVTVTVGEERLVAIPQLLHSKPGTQVIILDDAFQHRHVRAGLNIVLTEYGNLYTRDFMFPAGDLRDVKVSIKRADIIVITKCPDTVTIEEKNKISHEVKAIAAQQVFFTTTVYGKPYHLFSKEEKMISANTSVLLITGIANPQPLKELLTRSVSTYDMLRYADHHIFQIDDLEDIKAHFKKIAPDNKIILTTEKDAVRLQKFKTELEYFPIYVIPVQHSFLFNEGPQFDLAAIDFIRSFKK
ncbi:MAG TPA: tetraacyldisaccharide 4'-kinase [Ferruginibacter sp.]|jgi:tetraacyldisaccharide 4'-kinase|nr:tetraacyldisaccharide 4'-kinase [Ferruginibacter sp.]